MKTVKSYFNEENILNKGYGKDSDFYSKAFLSAKATLLNFKNNEDLDQNSINKIIEMAQRDQQHKHNLEKAEIRHKNIIKYFGYICNVLNIAITSIFFFLISTYSIMAAITFSVAIICFTFGVQIFSYLSLKKQAEQSQKKDSYYPQRRNRDFRGSQKYR